MRNCAEMMLADDFYIIASHGIWYQHGQKK